MNISDRRKKLSDFLSRKKKAILKEWSASIFRVPGHRRLKDIVPRKAHLSGMSKYLKDLIYESRNTRSHACHETLKRLILKDYLSINTPEDVIHGQILLRNIVSDMLIHQKANLPNEAKHSRRLFAEEISKAMLCVLGVYRKRDYKRLQTIVRYGKRLLRVHNLGKLCSLIVEAAIKESNADRVSLMLLEEDGYLYIKDSIGIPKKILKNLKVRVGTGISGKVAKRKEPIIRSEGEKIKPSIKKRMRGLGIRSAVSIPVMTDGEVLGVINIGKAHSDLEIF
jgi:putative methionine-R-sulfoxide reductase with GAF domain